MEPKDALVKPVSPEAEKPKPKTKIAVVREQLQTNPNLYFAGEIHHYHSTAPESGDWTETVDIIVAPKKPIFDADKLNTLMDGLITNIEPSAKDKALNRSDGGLDLGKLYFDETIGTMQQITITKIQTAEPETIKKAKKTVGETRKENQYEMQRRTWVRVYPDSTSAAIVCEYENGVRNGTVESSSELGFARYWIDGEQLRQLKAQNSRSPITTVKRLLHKGS